MSTSPSFKKNREESLRLYILILEGKQEQIVVGRPFPRKRIREGNEYIINVLARAV